MKISLGHNIKKEWLLDEEITFLNNGSFGSVPKIILEEYEKLNRLIEKEPLEFFLRQYFPMIRESAKKLADFVGVSSEDLVFVENATAGVNTILSSITPLLNQDDEILYTNYVYPAVKNAIHYICKKTGAKAQEIIIPYPIEDNKIIINSIEEGLSRKTKIAVIDQIASSTSIILPIKDIVQICRANGTLILIDGAHSPGMIDLNIKDLNPDFFVGNCHKWLYTPKGTALLYCRKELQEFIHPLVISLDYEKGFTNEFDWVGTRNPASWLSVPKALEFYNSIGKQEIISYIHNLSIDASELLIQELNINMNLNRQLHGAMVSFPIENENISNKTNPNELRNLFYDKYRIEIPFFNFNGRILFRISAQIYNEFSDYEKLILPLKKEFFN